MSIENLEQKIEKEERLKQLKSSKQAIEARGKKKISRATKEKTKLAKKYY
jgi:hypothetical protein